MRISMRAGGVALGAALSFALAGCAAPFGLGACPAIGWSNSLAVTLTGDAAEVADVQVCTDAGCAPRADMDAGDPLALVTLEGPEESTWIFSTDMVALEVVTIRVLGADGDVLADRPASPEWVRTGGSERCGGPQAAEVTVDL